MNTATIFQHRRLPHWALHAAAVIGLIVYFVQSVGFAHTTVSNLDEGAYLLKGVLFASGKYRPFDPGIWTNKAPLAFLIPGYVQAVFGPGLRTGRYLATFFGVMAVIGTWVAARRLSGNWLAAGAVWILALSPAVIKYYSNGATQSTIACLLAWSLVLTLGEKRPPWQLALAGFLSGAMILVRQNMVPVLPLLALYAFWQHGWKAIWLLITGLAVFIAFHVMYWPDIMQLWSWVPRISMPAGTIYTGGGTRSYTPEIEWETRLLSIFQALRFHFAAITGSILCLLLWPKAGSWKSSFEFRTGLFLFTLFWGLVLMHSMAAIGQEYCVYCFAPYIAFFNIAGILFLVLVIGSWNRQPSKVTQIVILLSLIVISTGMGYSAFEDIGSSILDFPAPRIKDMRILAGWVTWREILFNRFHLDINAAKKIASAATGLLLGILGTLILYGSWRTYVKKLGRTKFAVFYASCFLILGITASPLLHGSAGRRDCELDVIAGNEENGEYLKSIISDNELIYWEGGLSAAPLLYVPDAEIIPAQINNGYAFFGGGNTEELRKFGLWNEVMDAEWREEAGFFIIEEARYPGWMEFFAPDQFDEYGRTPQGTSCLMETRLRIFRRK